MNKPAVILVRPQMGENIGAAARAMFNFDLTDLRLVEPRDGWPSTEAERNSAGALEHMQNVRVFETLQDAVADLHFTLATTARPRDMAKKVFEPGQAAQTLREKSKTGEKTGIVFGAERTGLTNDELALSQAVITIPANPDFSSLNLAQSVLLLAYEYSISREGNQPITDTRHVEKDKQLPATQSKLEEFFVRLETELESGGFFKSPDLKPTMVRNIRTMFLRSNLTDQELRTLHGMLSALKAHRR